MTCRANSTCTFIIVYDSLSWIFKIKGPWKRLFRNAKRFPRQPPIHTSIVMIFLPLFFNLDGKCLACTFRAKFVEVSVGINHNVDELLAGTLTQIRLKKEHFELQVIVVGALCSRKKSVGDVRKCETEWMAGSVYRSKVADVYWKLFSQNNSFFTFVILFSLLACFFSRGQKKVLTVGIKIETSSERLWRHDRR